MLGKPEQYIVSHDCRGDDVTDTRCEPPQVDNTDTASSPTIPKNYVKYYRVRFIHKNRRTHH